MRTVLCFGTFDCLHAGHQDFFRQARTLGDRLIVVVARDTSVLAAKNRPTEQTEQARLNAVRAQEAVDEALLGDQKPGSYALLSQLTFDIVALGYDQTPSDSVVCQELQRLGKNKVRVVRLEPYQAAIYKSSRLRKNNV